MQLVTKYFKNSLTRFTSVIIVLTINVSGCSKSGLFEGAGDVKTVVLNLNDFTEIELNDKINLVLTYDTINQIRLEAGTNLIKGIEATINGDKLILKDNNKYKWSRDLDYNITVYVNRNHLKKISYYGAGNISSGNLWKAEEFIVDSWTGIGTIDLQLETSYTELLIRQANADIRLRGTTRFTRVYCADHGSVNLRDFKSKEMLVDYRSIRNSYVNVSSLLTANILYKGNVYYKGTPELITFFNSSGKLIPEP